MNITDYIPYGKENAVDRLFLTSVTGLRDREVRKLIQSARNRGALILNDQDGRGYYRSLDVGDLKRQYQTNKNRAMSILLQNAQLARMIVQLDDINKYQVTIEEVETDG